ncbi:MAG: MATE family efflux transporter [Synergistaceae bacterium]|nr:MATE family efflux transporter [Synergistaceae bacterium]
MKPSADLLKRLRKGDALNLREQLALITRLSVPAMLAQFTAILMGYIDAAMVGRLGARDSASIGLITTTTWLIYGLCSAVNTGFNVQVAHQIGGGREEEARSVVRHGLLAALGVSVLLAVLCAAISESLPLWLGGEEAIRPGASRYFLIFALTLPAFQLSHAAGGMLQCSGNMRLPSLINVLMCLLNTLFNALLIFPSHGWIPGAGLGVTGAALGTLLAETVSAGLMLFFLLVRSPALALRRGELKGRPTPWLAEARRALRIGLPVAFEGLLSGGAYVLSTVIVAPLGTSSIAANSFAVTAEGFCYMPAYGIATASTALIGQSVGAGRAELTKKLGWLTMAFGMAAMALSGALLWLFAPKLIGMMTSDLAIRELGTAALRIAAFSEPLYAAAVVGAGIFRGKGDTLISCVLNFFSMWVIRLPLMAWLSKSMGLRGVWLGMCLELYVRGGLFLFRLRRTDKRVPLGKTQGDPASF